MPFPLPKDPQFRLEVAESWLDDVEDRLELRDKDKALDSWKIANSLLLSLPPGKGDILLERRLVELRVKIGQHSTKQVCGQ